MSDSNLDLEAIFLNALEKSTPEARRLYLDEQCGESGMLRRQVEELLDANREMSNFLDQTRVLTKDRGGREAVGTKIGPYELVKPIGEGGMGAVYVAQQTQPVKRQVALKVIKPGLDTREVLSRFAAERQALALMNHPNIAKVYDAGETESGRPYFVMELVEGTPIVQFCDENKLSVRSRLELFVNVCFAIQHAHQKGIIHRDIKPANVLVALHDGKPVVKVIDFGVAKAINRQNVERSVHTQLNQVLGTPMYMSPEQAQPGGLDIDTRTDIYSLGVLLYELLTGKTPYDNKRIREAAFDEVRRIIREETPLKPSSQISSMGDRATSVSRDRQTDSRRLSQLLYGDVDWIIMKSLEKERSRRYETANEFAFDVQRFLSDQPVLAGPPSWTYRCKKFVKRNRKPLFAATLVIGIVFVAGWLINDRLNATYAQGQIGALLKAEITRVPEIVDSINAYRRWTYDDLQQMFNDPELNSDQKARVALALLPLDDTKVGYLKKRMLHCTPIEHSVIRDSLEPYGTRLGEELWQLVQDKSRKTAPRFSAACALAKFDPSAKNWDNEELRKLVAGHLVSVLPSELDSWRKSLVPVKDKIMPAITEYYLDRDATAEKRLFATTTLAVYAADQPSVLFELLAEAELNQFELIFDKLQLHTVSAIQSAENELVNVMDAALSEAEKDDLAMRKANAAICLIRLNKTDSIWQLFRHSHDPRVRSFIVNWMAKLNCNPKIIVERYLGESDISTQRALLLGLSEFSEDDFREIDIAGFNDQLCKDYRNHPDAGLHSSIEYLLAKLGHKDKVVKIRNDLAEIAHADELKKLDRHWFVNGQGQTFTILKADESQIGSPESEPERIWSERMHTRSLNRKFAIATTEVTRAQWRAFSKKFEGVISADDQDVIPDSPTDDCPMTGPPWFEAARFCNWISEQEGIPADQWCYEPNEQQEFKYGMQLKKDFLNLSGYRLPTEAEWEFACRAGSVTSRYYGHNVELLRNYAWYQPSSDGQTWPVGSLKPNDFGLFDMLGNTFEWCSDVHRFWVDEEPPTSDANTGGIPVTAELRCVIRGGCFSMPSLNSRSAYRNGIQPDRSTNVFGIRLVRTIESYDAKSPRKEVDEPGA